MSDNKYRNLTLSISVFISISFPERLYRIREYNFKEWHLRLLYLKYRNHFDDTREYCRKLFAF